MTPKGVPLFCQTCYLSDFSGVTTPTSVFGDKLVDFTSLAFIEQQEPPSFFALAVEQLADFSVEHSLVDFAAVEQWSSLTFLTAAVFVAQHEDPAFVLAAADVEHDSPLPANARLADTKRPAAIMVMVRMFIVRSCTEMLCVDFYVLIVQNRTLQASFAKEFPCQEALFWLTPYVVPRKTTPPIDTLRPVGGVL